MATPTAKRKITKKKKTPKGPQAINFRLSPDDQKRLLEIMEENGIGTKNKTIVYVLKNFRKYEESLRNQQEKIQQLRYEVESANELIADFNNIQNRIQDWNGK